MYNRDVMVNVKQTLNKQFIEIHSKSILRYF